MYIFKSFIMEKFILVYSYYNIDGFSNYQVQIKYAEILREFVNNKIMRFNYDRFQLIRNRIILEQLDFEYALEKEI